jgi:hypothetical protein
MDEVNCEGLKKVLDETENKRVVLFVGVKHSPEYSTFLDLIDN